MTPNTRSLTSLPGVILIVFVAFSFAANSTLSKIALDHGATPLSLLNFRTAIAAFSVFVILKIWRVPIGLPFRVRWIAIGMGGIVALYSYCLMSALLYLPVALAVLTFYLYPILTSLGSWAIGQERLTFRILVCLITAFIGLGFALDIGGNINLVGISLAIGAAVGFTVLLLVNNNLGDGQDSRPISFHMMSSATLLFILMDMNAGDIPLPVSFEGIAAFIGSCVFFAFAMIGMFVGLAKIGAIRTSLLMNFEPVASIVLGALLLDQVLEPLQLVGAGVVIAAILLAELVKNSSEANENV